MKKSLLIIVLVILISITGCMSGEQPVVGGKVKAIDCKSEQRNVDGCIEIYQPVCGQLQVQCVTAPCDPVKETFENSCKACANPNVISYIEGECLVLEDIKR
jgi:hypothetical protein